MSENLIVEEKESSKQSVNILRNRLSVDHLIIQNPIQNSEVEGEIYIKTVESFKLSLNKNILFWFLTLGTFGILWLISNWVVRIKILLRFEESNPLGATHYLITNSDGSSNIVEKQSEYNSKKKEQDTFFVNNLIKYTYNILISKFQAQDLIQKGTTHKQITIKHFKGINYDESVLSQKQFGKCQMNIPIPTLSNYLGEQAIQPFYILAYFSIFIWFLEGFYLYLGIMIIATLLMTIVQYVFLKKGLIKLNELARNDAVVKVFRQGNYQDFIQLPVQDLVPGDIFAIDDRMQIPCDCILVTGDVVLNECMLTGESIPIPKIAIYASENEFCFNKSRSHIMFEGTKCLQVKAAEHKYTLALVTRTGFCSLKGQLIRTILFPKIEIDLFFRSIIKLLGFFSVLAISLYFVMLSKMNEDNFPTILKLLRLADIVLYTIPPQLLILIQFPLLLSITRLKKIGIIGIFPEKLMDAGKIEVFCFDKTGTLTDIDIDVYGIHTEEKGLELTESIHDDQKSQTIFKVMSTCHSVMIFDGQPLGDPLDIRMQEFSGWKINKQENPLIKQQVIKQNQKLNVLKSFDFESELQRSSVVVQDDDKFFVFFKGSPEKTQELSLKQTIPSNYQEQLDQYSLKGYRILSLAYKQLENFNQNQVQDYDRSVAESQLNFLGFLIMENKLKHDSASCVASLKEANIDVKMISGDNALTCIQTSKNANIIDPLYKVLLLDIDSQQEGQIKIKYIEPEQSSDSRKSITQFNQHQKVLQDNMSNPNLINPYQQLEVIKSLVENKQPLEYAMTGKFFKKFYQDDQPDEKLVKLLQKTNVFSRMSPEQKALIIKFIQNSGKFVGMCGDGANDTMALKQGNVGISFTATDASLAAPFATIDLSISCVEKLLLEGRAALTNNIEIFKTIIMASFLKIIATVFLCYTNYYFQDFQYVYINYFGILLAQVLIGFSEPVRKLNKEIPWYNFFSMVNLSSIFGNFIIVSVAYVILFFHLKQSTYYVEGVVKNDEYDTTGAMNTTFFWALYLFTIISTLAIVISHPFKQPVWKNYYLFGFCVIMIFYNSLSVIDSSVAWSALGYEYNMSASHRVEVIIIILIFGVILFAYEELIVKKLIKKLSSR